MNEVSIDYRATDTSGSIDCDPIILPSVSIPLSESCDTSTDNLVQWEEGIPQKEWLPKCDYEGYFIRGIFLEMQHGDGLFVVSEPNSNAYGAGVTMNEAVEEFKSMLVDLFEELTKSENILSHCLSRQLSPDYSRS